MPLSRLLATGLWFGVTAAATAMVWGATSIVAADVTDRPAPVVAHREVVSELASGSANRPAAPPVTAPKAATGTSTVPPRNRAPGSAGPPTSVPAATPPQTSPPPTAASPVTPTTVKASPVVAPTIPATTLASPQTATFATAGGAVGVSCTGFFITLVSAIPSNGFAAVIVARGPANVEVHFVGSGQDLSVKAVCFGHPIRYYNDLPIR